MGLGLLNSSISNQIRNFLLSRSINPTVESTLGGVGSMNVNRGTPTSVENPNGNTNILNTSTVSSLGEYYLKPIGLKNRYNPTSYEQTIVNDLNPTSGNIGTYEDYARTRSTYNFNISQLFTSSNLISSSLETPLGVIGAERLKFSLEENIAANTIKNSIGRVNTNIFSLINGEEFLIRDYQITEFPATGLGYFGNLLQKYSGIEIPFSIIPGSAFGFMDSLFKGKVDYSNCNLQELDDTSRDTIVRNNILLRYTGKGNRVQLFNLLGINKYRPDYENQNGDQFLNRIFGFLQQQKGNENSSYDRLEKTRRPYGTLPVMLFQNIATSTNGDWHKGAFLEDDPRSVLQPNGLPKIAWDNKDNLNPTGFKRFMFSIENLAWIGHTDGLPICEIGNGDTDSNNKEKGRIMWFPPYGLTFNENVNVKWEQTEMIGRGEPIFTYNNTVRAGTIQFKIVVDHPSLLNQMRDKNFTNSDFNKFFEGCDGKNTVNAALNILKSNSNISYSEKSTLETKIIKASRKDFKKETNVVSNPGGSPINIKIYYPNASNAIESTYENGTNTQSSTQANTSLPGQVIQSYTNTTDFGLNVKDNGFLSPNTIDKLQNLYTSGASTVDKINVVISISNTSVGGDQLNSSLGDKRFESAKTWITGQLGLGGSNPVGVTTNPVLTISKGHIVTASVSNSDVSSFDQKSNRWASIDISVVLKDTTESREITKEINTPTDIETQNTVTQLIKKTVDPVYKECDYFYFLEKNEPFLFKKFKEKIKYFHPGFHSTTPEGLNSRLTFLHQCTRQGPSINESGKSSNLAFGRPPFCILRIGDFFHTKMIIQNMSISYDESLWDLNPEGIGVQPRIATVDLSVTYLGGQSLMGPIRELQNALGFNFYANTETFQHKPSIHEETVGITQSPGILMDDDQLLNRPTSTDNVQITQGVEVQGLNNPSGLDTWGSPFNTPSFNLK